MSLADRETNDERHWTQKGRCLTGGLLFYSVRVLLFTFDAAPLSNVRTRLAIIYQRLPQCQLALLLSVT